MAEQQILFLKMKNELLVSMKKNVAKVEHDLMNKVTREEVENKAKLKIKVCSKATQVEPGDFPLHSKNDNLEDLEDSISLLA